MVSAVARTYWGSGGFVPSGSRGKAPGKGALPPESESYIIIAGIISA
jgi:hypothetical protein